MNEVTAAPLSSDPKALIRTRQYRVLLILAALVGILVSAASSQAVAETHDGTSPFRAGSCLLCCAGCWHD